MAHATSHNTQLPIASHLYLPKVSFTPSQLLGDLPKVVVVRIFVGLHVISYSCVLALPGDTCRRSYHNEFEEMTSYLTSKYTQLGL